jgi:hypothetical protein
MWLGGLVVFDFDETLATKQVGVLAFLRLVLLSHRWLYERLRCSRPQVRLFDL